MIPGADPVRRVTIVPRGQALGVTYQMPLDDRHNYPEDYLRARIIGALGGRAAEEIVFGSITSGAENDLKQVTDIARQMVTKWGMSKTLGLVSYGGADDEVFLGRELAMQRNYSDETAAASTRRSSGSSTTATIRPCRRCARIWGGWTGLPRRCWTKNRSTRRKFWTWLESPHRQAVDRPRPSSPRLQAALRSAVSIHHCSMHT